MQTIPTIIYSFFAGSLSDDFGRKSLIMLPTIGSIIGTIFSLINYTFIEKLSIDFFYITGAFWWSILGGSSIYYLGIYGFGASITNTDNRAKIIGRFDAMKILGTILGIIFNREQLSTGAVLGKTF